MKKRITNSVICANSSTAMETGDHFKNGVSLKNQRSRINFLKICAIALLFFGGTSKAVANPWDISDLTGACGNSNVTATLDQSTHTLTISGTGCMADFWCSAEPYNGQAPWYKENLHTTITKVIIQGTVQNIGDKAFIGCTSLTSVVFESTAVWRIGKKAFEGCSSLQTIKIPSSVTEIEGEVFLNCSSLHTLELADGSSTLNFTGYNLANPCTGTNINTYNWFTGCNLLKTLYLGREINNWGTSNSNQPIFYLKNKLTTLTIGKLVMSIGTRAFNDCIYLETVTIAEGDATTPRLRFIGTYSQGHFLSSPIEKLFLGRNLETEYISGNYSNGYPFYNNPSLKTVNIGCFVTAINDYSFKDCVGLLSLTWCGGALTTIGSEAFYNCNKLVTQLDVPHGVTRIGSSAFQHCASLPSVVIPTSVMSIEYRAFNNCGLLKVVTIEEGDATTPRLRFIGTYSQGHFSSSPIETLFLGRNLETEYISGNYSNGYPFYNNPSLKTVNIGCFVTAINDYSFKDCVGLLSLTWCGGALTTIGSEAFYNCNKLVTQLDVPHGVTRIGSSAFQYCASLPSVVIPTSVMSIEYRAFNNCGLLKTVTIVEGDALTPRLRFIGSSSQGHFSSSPIETLFLGRNLETEYIGGNYSNGYPFYNNQYLKYLTIGSRVTSINDYSFKDCTGLQVFTSNPIIMPPTLYNNSFSYNAIKTIPVYINCDYLNSYNTAQYWSEFTNYQCAVKVTPSSTSVVFTFPKIDDAVAYTLCLYGDENHTELIKCFKFDANGNIIGKSTLTYTVTDLDADMQYYYSLASHNIDTLMITQFTGDFNTMPLSINEFIINEIAIHPNPTSGQLTIKNRKLTIENAEYRIYSPIGQLLMQGKLQGETTTVNVVSLAKGIYYLQIGGQTVKFVKE